MLENMQLSVVVENKRDLTHSDRDFKKQKNIRYNEYQKLKCRPYDWEIKKTQKKFNTQE